jgi:putative transposase
MIRGAGEGLGSLYRMIGRFGRSQAVGFVKGKSAIPMAWVYGERKRDFVGRHFWARGFFVNTFGRDEEAIRAYIRNQEKEDERLE